MVLLNVMGNGAESVTSVVGDGRVLVPFPPDFAASPVALPFHASVFLRPVRKYSYSIPRISAAPMVSVDGSN